MCGIFGYVGTRLEASQLVLAGLKKLEYRGYDSWGIASRQDVVAHMLEDELTRREASGNDGERLVQALMTVFRRLDGLSALGVIDRQEQCIAAAKNGSPLVLGWGEDGNYLASDSSALLEHTRQLTFLEDGQAALIGTDFVKVYDAASGQAESDVHIWDITWQEEVD